MVLMTVIRIRAIEKLLKSQSCLGKEKKERHNFKQRITKSLKIRKIQKAKRLKLKSQFNKISHLQRKSLRAAVMKKVKSLDSSDLIKIS